MLKRRPKELSILEHIVGIVLEGFFCLHNVTFFKTLMADYESPVSIDSSGQSCLQGTETPSFGPATSGLVPENYL